MFFLAIALRGGGVSNLVEAMVDRRLCLVFQCYSWDKWDAMILLDKACGRV